MKWYEEQTGFYYKKEKVTRGELDTFWEEALANTSQEVQDVVLFSRTKGKKIENPDLKRNVEGELIEAAGNMHLIVPGKLMQGSFVADSDTKGCVVSKKTADTLFGSYDVIGETICLEEKNYIIRGIVSLNSQLCMVQGAKGTSYPYIRIEAPGLPVSALKQTFAGILPSECTWISEGGLYAGIARIFVWIPAWVLFFTLLSLCRRGIRWFSEIKEGWKYQELSVQILKTMLPVIGFAGCCGLLLVSLHFSDDYIPTAWSDFSFWTELARTKWDAFLTLIKSTQQLSDSAMLGNLAGVICAMVPGSFLLGHILQVLLKERVTEMSQKSGEKEWL